MCLGISSYERECYLEDKKYFQNYRMKTQVFVYSALRMKAYRNPKRK